MPARPGLAAAKCCKAGKVSNPADKSGDTPVSVFTGVHARSHHREREHLPQAAFGTRADNCAVIYSPLFAFYGGLWNFIAF